MEDEKQNHKHAWTWGATKNDAYQVYLGSDIDQHETSINSSLSLMQPFTSEAQVFDFSDEI